MKRPNASPATPPIAPDIADLTKQLFMNSWAASTSGVGISMGSNFFFFFSTGGGGAGGDGSADDVDAVADEATRSSSVEPMMLLVVTELYREQQTRLW